MHSWYTPTNVKKILSQVHHLRMWDIKYWMLQLLKMEMIIEAWYCHCIYWLPFFQSSGLVSYAMNGKVILLERSFGLLCSLHLSICVSLPLSRLNLFLSLITTPCWRQDQFSVKVRNIYIVSQIFLMLALYFWSGNCLSCMFLIWAFNVLIWLLGFNWYCCFSILGDCIVICIIFISKVIIDAMNLGHWI